MTSARSVRGTRAACQCAASHRIASRPLRIVRAVSLRAYEGAFHSWREKFMQRREARRIAAHGLLRHSWISLTIPSILSNRSQCPPEHFRRMRSSSGYAFFALSEEDLCARVRYLDTSSRVHSREKFRSPRESSRFTSPRSFARSSGSRRLQQLETQHECDGRMNSGWWQKTSAGTKSQELVLTQMHPLNDIPAIVEHSLDVLRVDGTREVRITIVLAVAARRTYTLQEGTNATLEHMENTLEKEPRFPCKKSALEISAE